MELLIIGFKDVKDYSNQSQSDTKDYSALIGLKKSHFIEFSQDFLSMLKPKSKTTRYQPLQTDFQSKISVWTGNLMLNHLYLFWISVINR